jgi:hypothetical protein
LIINESQSAKPDEQSNHGGRSARAHQNQRAQLRSSTPEIPEDFKHNAVISPVIATLCHSTIRTQ